MKLMQNLEFLIEKTAEIEKLVVQQNKNELETVNLFYHTILVRTNSILNSVYILSNQIDKNKYAIHILLRPLILDYYYIHFLVQKYWVKNNSILDKNNIENLAYLCLTDGVKSSYQSVRKSLNYLSEEEKKEIENNFKNLFAFCIKDIDVSFDKLEFDIDLKNDESITASKIEKQLQSGDINGDRLKKLYDFLSKYDHNTIVGYLDYVSLPKNTKIIEESIFIIRKNFIYFLLLIWEETKISEVLVLYNNELKNE